MKIDLSTVLLVIVCIIPGLFAQRSRNLICPRSLDPQGDSTELGELVALGIATHGILICVGASILVLLGLCLHFSPTIFFRSLDSWSAENWCRAHQSESLLFGTFYIFLSFALSHWLGVIYGIWRLRSPVTTGLLKGSTWLQRMGINGLLIEKPIIYEALSPKIDEQNRPFLVFVEVQMKDDKGFYSGQLSQFAIVKDEEPHKPIFLINVWYKKNPKDKYEQIEADGVMLDLADSVHLFVEQVPRSQ